LRILQIGCGAATAETLAFAGRHGARLTIFDANARALEGARLSYGHTPETSPARPLVQIAEAA
jgi:16S rRNA G1207 methylase RsmC